MGLRQWIERKVASRWLRGKWDAFQREAFDKEGNMKPSLKKSAQKTGMELGRVAAAGAIAAVLAYSQSPDFAILLEQIGKDVPSWQWLLVLIPALARYVQQAIKHRER